MNQIEEIKQKIDIVDLISEYVDLKKMGRNFKAICPFHEEKTPSFMVSRERQIFKCFGCGIGGDIYKFLMELDGIEFGEALQILAKKAGVELKKYKPSEQQQHKERLLEINHLASEYYHYLLIKHKVGEKALDYLLKRGISKSSMKLFKLGYSSNEWSGLVDYLVKKKKYKFKELEEAGLIIKGNRNYYDRFRGRIIFPLFDYRKRAMGFSGRVLDKEQKTAKYINSPETVLYHKSDLLYGLEQTKKDIKKQDIVVVTEGELDMISSYQVGIKNVVAIKGSALTENQLRLLKRFCGNIYLSLDNDLAGDKACWRGISLAEELGFNVRVIKLKYGKDPDECAQKSAKLWKDSVKSAIPIYDFYIKSSIEKFGIDTPEGKRKISQEVSSVLSNVNNRVIQSHYIKKLAEELNVSEDAVAEEVRKTYKNVLKKPLEVKVREVSRKEKSEEYILALLLQEESQIEELINLIKDDLLEKGTAISKVVQMLRKWLKKHKWDINKFVKDIPEELIAVIDKAYLTDLSDISKDSDKLKSEISKIINELAKIKLKNNMERLSREIKDIEKGNDKKKLKKLQKEFIESSKQLKEID